MPTARLMSAASATASCALTKNAAKMTLSVKIRHEGFACTRLILHQGVHHLPFRRQNWCFTTHIRAAHDMEESRRRYDKLLQKARHWTLDAPEGQLLGRAGQRCVLEDGERALTICVSMQPEALSPRILLMTNLILQNRGREREVPLLAIQTLKATRLQKCREHCVAEDIDSCVHVVELGLRALKKAGREHSMRRFVADAAAAMPALDRDFEQVAAARFHMDLRTQSAAPHSRFADFLTSEEDD